MSIFEGVTGYRTGIAFDNLFFHTGPIFQLVYLNFVIEMANITDNCLIFHLADMFRGDNIAITGSGYKNIRNRQGIFDSANLESGHTCLQRANRVNLAYQNLCALIAHRFRRALANIAIAANHGSFA